MADAESNAAAPALEKQKLAWRERLMKDLRAAHPNVPMVAAMFGGLLFLGIAEATASNRILALTLSCFGNCLLVLAVASKIINFRWLRRTRILTLLLYVAYAAASSAIVVNAVYTIKNALNPDTWIMMHSNLVRLSQIDLARHYYLVDLTPSSKHAIERVWGPEKETGPAYKSLLQQVARKLPDDYVYVDWCTFRNTGWRRVTDIELPLTIFFSKKSGTPDIPPKKSIVLPVKSLAPGEDVHVVFFSTDPNLYSEVLFPLAGTGRFSGSGTGRPLRINYSKDGLERMVLVSGEEYLPEEKKPALSSDSKQHTPLLQNDPPAQKPFQTPK